MQTNDKIWHNVGCSANHHWFIFHIITSSINILGKVRSFSPMVRSFGEGDRPADLSLGRLLLGSEEVRWAGIRTAPMLCVSIRGLIDALAFVQESSNCTTTDPFKIFKQRQTWVAWVSGFKNNHTKRPLWMKTSRHHNTRPLLTELILSEGYKGLHMKTYGIISSDWTLTDGDTHSVRYTGPWWTRDTQIHWQQNGFR